MAEPIRLLLTAHDAERVRHWIGPAVADRRTQARRKTRVRRLFLLLVLLLVAFCFFTTTRG